MKNGMLNNCRKQQNKGALEFDSFLKFVTNFALGGGGGGGYLHVKRGRGSSVKRATLS